MNLFDELTWRGLVYDATDGLAEAFEKERVTAYIGFDPTASSLHIGNLLGLVRQLRFRQLAESQGVIQHGKSSLGKAIEAELEGAGSLPDQVVLDVPVFQNVPLPSQRVLCALDIDAATEKLALIPLPGCLELALQEVERQIALRLSEGLLSEGLAESQVPIYYGSA
jgi:hypothetical protein